MTEYQMVKISIYLVTSMQYRNETVARTDGCKSYRLYIS